MAKTPNPTKRRERERMDDRTLEEEPPITPEQARRELGFDLLPFNGGDREDFED